MFFFFVIYWVDNLIGSCRTENLKEIFPKMHVVLRVITFLD